MWKCLLVVVVILGVVPEFDITSIHAQGCSSVAVVRNEPPAAPLYTLKCQGAACCMKYTTASGLWVFCSCEEDEDNLGIEPDCCHMRVKIDHSAKAAIGSCEPPCPGAEDTECGQSSGGSLTIATCNPEPG